MGRCGAAGLEASRCCQPEMAENTNKIIYYHSTYRHGVDDKRRVQIPAKWRPEAEDAEFTVILWSDNGQSGPCLRVLPQRQIDALMQRIESMSTSDPKDVALRRNIAKCSDTVTIDKGGRICIPENMARKAGIGKEAVLAGALQWFEVWNPEAYEAVSATDDILSPEALNKI